MIRRNGPASWRTKAKPTPGWGGSAHREGLPEKRCARAVACVTTGRLEDRASGLGIPAGHSGAVGTPAGDRGVVVPLKPVKADGGKGARKLDRGVCRW